MLSACGVYGCMGVNKERGSFCGERMGEAVNRRMGEIEKGGFMSLGRELERNIRDAWLRLRKEILSDPQELQGRLARRRGKSMGRPPRAWCVAIRASDR